MNQKTISQILSIILFGFITLCVGCETEQEQSIPKNKNKNNNNNAMIGYAQDFARTQAELENQEQLKKLSDSDHSYQN